MIEIISQIIISLTGIIAIILAQTKNMKYRKYGAIIGLIGQPFWFVTAYNHQQWGIFTLSFFYTGAWIFGVYNLWWKKDNVTV